MNDLDFENKLKQQLNRSVDAELGSRRQPPVFQIPEHQHGIRPWLVPLAIAAAVVTVVTGTVGASHLLSESHSAAPATSGPTVSPPPSTSAPETSSAPTPSDSPSQPASTTPTAAPVRLAPLGSFQIAVPEGWVVRDSSQYLPRGESRWCLSPASIPASPNSCPVSLLEPNPLDNPLDSSFPGGLVSNPEYCGPGQNTGGATTIERTVFGGRTADHVSFEEDCADGRKLHQEQYMLPYGQSMVLFAENPTSQLSTGMSFIVQNSQAPSRISQIPLYYHGTITAVSPLGTGHKVTIAGANYPGQGAAADPVPASLTVDFQVKPIGGPLAIGKQLAVCTDGSQVTLVQVLN